MQSRGSLLYECTMLEEELKPSDFQFAPREPLTVEEQVAVCLYYFGSCCEYRVVGDVFGIHRSTVWKCIHRVTDAILKVLMPIWIKMPDKEECENIAEYFEEKTNIPQAILVIDGSHIPVSAPKIGYQDYVNRKGWTSIVLQGVVDNKLLFRNIYCQEPGCTHDATVLRNSNLFKYKDLVIPDGTKEINGVKIPYLIVGDPAYPLLPWLMKNYIYTSKISVEEDSFNVYLNKIRVNVEIAFGHLKNRWRRLLKKIECHISFVPQLVAACCVLHNITTSFKDNLNENWMRSCNTTDND